MPRRPASEGGKEGREGGKEGRKEGREAGKEREKERQGRERGRKEGRKLWCLLYKEGRRTRIRKRDRDINKREYRHELPFSLPLLPPRPPLLLFPPPPPPPPPDMKRRSWDTDQPNSEGKKRGGRGKII